MTDPRRPGLERLATGAHLCGPYRDPAELTGHLAHWIVGGLTQGAWYDP